MQNLYDNVSFEFVVVAKPVAVAVADTKFVVVELFVEVLVEVLKQGE